MRCQDCKKREAQVHLTQITNNVKTTLHLCKECAAARGFHSPLDSVPFPLADILSGLAADTHTSGKEKVKDNITCQKCGLSFEAFTRQGRFGCGDCYRTFRHRLEPIMRKIHGASLHRGRTPQFEAVASKGSQLIPVKEEERLEEELKKAIEMEDFERAAEIRDKLKTLRECLPLDK
ncbi:MAG: UvrB/UvrC motif-containing protein [Candidatus Zixiibacteriota bacterium]